MTDLNDLLVPKTFVALHSQDKIGLRFVAEMYFSDSLKDSRDLKVKKEICLCVLLCENQRQCMICTSLSWGCSFQVRRFCPV